jgi:predicted esterase YcpF (UPF0227 family)
MNIHSLADVVTVDLSRFVAGDKKIFSQSIDSPSIAEHMEAVELRVPDFHGLGQYEVIADTLVGRIDPGFLVYQWLGGDHPTVLYHHGNSERPFDFGMFSKNTFKWIFARPMGPIDANLIAIRAPFHQGPLTPYLRKMGHVRNAAAMIATSVVMIEHLVGRLKKATSGHLMVAGISLGGWITNLHKIRFDTADVYVPLLAGAALAEVFLGGIYRKVTGELALENPSAIRRIFNFEKEFKAAPNGDVFPLLAAHDRIIDYQRQKQCYSDCSIQVVDRGHSTASRSPRLLRQHILTHLE